MRPDRPVDPTPLTIQLGPTKLAYTETGGGQPVVCVHGLPASHRDFRWLDAAFKGRVRLFRLDLPGFGASPAPDRANATYDAMAAAVAALCEASDLHNVIVLGHSLGGPIAVAAAIASPRITGVVLVNSAGPVQHRGNFPRVYRTLSRLADLHPLVERAVVATTKPIARRMGFSKHVRDDELLHAARLAARHDPAAFGVQLRTLDKPLFVAWSTADPAVQTAVSEGVLAAAAQSESLRFDARSHNLQSTHATELAQAILKWAE